MKTKIFAVLILAIGIIAVSCSKEKNSDNTSASGKPARISIRLTDAPGLYDAVNIDILSVSARIDSTWHDLILQTPGIYNLIALSNGNSALLVSDTSVPAGTITQMRLVLGDSNTIVVDGVTHDLKTPSGQTSGYKVMMNSALEPGGSYVVLLDFDASRSIVKLGNGNYLLKPVVHGNLMANIGQIDGIAVPDTAAESATAWNATDTFSVFVSHPSGYFLINSLVPGSYMVKITAIPPYKDTTFANVPVVIGQTTHLDSIHMKQ